MNVKNISMPSGIKYLSEVMPELPSNCLFDKGKVGCGGTTVALTNDKPYVVAVPFIPLIESKVAQNSNVFGVTGDTSSAAIKAYLKEAKVPKIMVTYDSLPKVMKYIDPSQFYLLVDEYHLLFTQYSFRADSAIKEVLKRYTDFKEYCFMTATVLEEEFILDELSSLPIVVAEWEDVKEVTVNSVQCIGSITQTVIYLINLFLAGDIDGNAYIFVNSVDFIKELVKACELNDSNSRAIWGKSNKKETGLIRGNSNDTPKKINLLTSTCFEGVDFYDEDGKIYIVSDSTKAHTLTDISTSFQQIAGRIRNTKYWDQINHIFSTTRYSSPFSYNDYKEYINESIKSDKRKMDQYNNLLDDEAREDVFLPNTNYLTKVNNKFLFDSNKVKIDLYNFKVTKSLYSLRVNVTTELITKGFKVIEHTLNIQNEIKVIEPQKTFKDIVKELKRIESEESEYDILSVHQLDTPLHKAAFEKYPFLEEILRDRLRGFEIIDEYNYHVGNLKKRHIQRLPISLEMKVFKILLLSNKVKVGKFISSSDAKALFKLIYNQLEAKKTAVGSHLNTYFETKLQTRRIDGQPINGYLIKKPKVIFHEDSSVAS